VAAPLTLDVDAFRKAAKLRASGRQVRSIFIFGPGGRLGYAVGSQELERALVEQERRIQELDQAANPSRARNEAVRAE
jgi:hypothetical protein